MSPRLVAAVVTILLFASAAHAATAEELTAAINKCAAIADDATRHACYDRLPTLVNAPTPVAAAKAPPLGAPQSTTPPPSAESGSSDGLFGLFRDVPVPADHISAKVESFTFDFGTFIVTLDNGQVWRQVAATGGLVHLSREKKDQVMIWRSSFGYDVLRIEGDHTTYHVRRIK